jgi:hypothetical protein
MTGSCRGSERLRSLPLGLFGSGGFFVFVWFWCCGWFSLVLFFRLVVWLFGSVWFWFVVFFGFGGFGSGFGLVDLDG